MKFVCDQMCAELGRWLRAAGYDTAIVKTPLKDEEIFERAVAEERLILTRDKYFLDLDTSKRHVFFLQNESLEEWVTQLKHKLGLNWLYKPFSRCLECNCALEKIDSPSNKEQWMLSNLPAHLLVRFAYRPHVKPTSTI